MDLTASITAMPINVAAMITITRVTSLSKRLWFMCRAERPPWMRICDHFVAACFAGGGSLAVKFCTVHRP